MLVVDLTEELAVYAQTVKLGPFQGYGKQRFHT